MIAYLSKSDASEGFNQIIDFLNGSSIKYALTVNPNIYVSCIKQFWTIVAIKKVNDVTRLQALVDKKKVVVTEALIKDALVWMMQKIHTIPQCMSAKRTSWNEFSSSMAYAVICLSPGRKFNFSKKQVGDLSSHIIKYTSPALTQKVFANMRRVGKGFSGVETPLFKGMIVEQQVAKGDADEVHGEDVNTASVATERDVSADDDDVPDKELSIPSPTPPTPPPQPSQDIFSTSQVQPTPPQSPQRVKKLKRRNKVKVLKLRRLQKVGTTQRIDTSDDTVMDDVSNQGRMIVKMDQDADIILEEDNETITAGTTITITTTEAQVPAATLIAAPSRVTAAPNKGKGDLLEEPKPLKKQAQIKQDEKYARELEVELNKNIDWDEVIDHVNKKAKEDPAIKREDLEALWILVKERFATTKPKNFSDDFLLITLGAMFEKPDIHAQIWKNQRSVYDQAKVKSWKLLESCDMVKEVERLSCKDVAKETVCLLRRAQKRELYMMTRLQMMADESHHSVRVKHTFVSKMNLGRLN
nr:hypothetical protein [Tanacetum cinerariifolium]